MDDRLLADALLMVENEVDAAVSEHAPMHSAHEGIADIREEFDELWDEIKKKRPDNESLLKEAAHLGAMAVRFIVDVCLAESATGYTERGE